MIFSQLFHQQLKKTCFNILKLKIKVNIKAALNLITNILKMMMQFVFQIQNNSRKNDNSKFSQ